ncbi:hypothetical protein BC826DRAFT_997566 [Russula brevipes]|nr:hypothetical protein BC826DRAFT_997566 [Russula brevipes]
MHPQRRFPTPPRTGTWTWILQARIPSAPLMNMNPWVFRNCNCTTPPPMGLQALLQRLGSRQRTPCLLLNCRVHRRPSLPTLSRLQRRPSGLILVTPPRPQCRPLRTPHLVTLPHPQLRPLLSPHLITLPYPQRWCKVCAHLGFDRSRIKLVGAPVHVMPESGVPHFIPFF